MIKLFQFPSLMDIPNLSPFCMKVETYLRMVNLPHEIIKQMDPRKAPKGKLPYIEDNGHHIADSSLIIAYLKKTYGDTLDKNLTKQQQAQAIALQRLMQEHLFWALLYSRWEDDANWPDTKKIFFRKLPFILTLFLPNLIRNKVIAGLKTHGLGRHSKDEIYQFGLEDLSVLATQLNDHSYLLGNEPSSIDACGYAFLANVLTFPTDSPLYRYAHLQPQFLDYCARMKERYYRNTHARP